MAQIDTIGLVEVSSIAAGFRVQDAMLKSAPVERLLARSICAGKFLVAVAGDVASVRASVAAGAAVAEGTLIEQGVLSRIHPSIFPALGQSVEVEPSPSMALGVVETFSAASIIGAADAAAKGAPVTLLRLQLAMAMGGKGFALLVGDQASVESAVEAAAAFAAGHGVLVGKVVIPNPAPELLQEFI
jgi:microcompartment protein CcmL/EutN